MLFDRLVTGQVVPMNPAAAVPRLNHVVNTGKALVLEAAKSTPAVILRDLRPGFLRTDHSAEDESRRA